MRECSQELTPLNAGKYSLCKCGICSEDIIVLDWSGITRDHIFEIAYEICTMNSGWMLFALRVASTWNSLPDDVVGLEALGNFMRAIRCSLNGKWFNFLKLILLRYFV